MGSHFLHSFRQVVLFTQYVSHLKMWFCGQDLEIVENVSLKNVLAYVVMV